MNSITLSLSAGTEALAGSTICVMLNGIPSATPLMKIYSLLTDAGGWIKTIFSPSTVSTRSVAVAFPSASTGTVISSLSPPTKVAPPPGEPTVKVTFSATRRLSTTLS